MPHTGLRLAFWLLPLTTPRVVLGGPLAPPLRCPSAAGRKLLQNPCAANSVSSGGNSAFSSASSTNNGGSCTSATQGAAMGAGSTTAQISQANGQTQSCFKGPSQAVSCSTLAPSGEHPSLLGCETRAAFCAPRLHKPHPARPCVALVMPNCVGWV